MFNLAISSCHPLTSVLQEKIVKYAPGSGSDENEFCWQAAEIGVCTIPAFYTPIDKL